MNNENTMSDTPETDKILERYTNYTPSGYEIGIGDVIDFARRLKRERDEARKIAQDWHFEWASVCGAERELLPWENPENASSVRPADTNQTNTTNE